MLKNVLKIKSTLRNKKYIVPFHIHLPCESHGSINVKSKLTTILMDIAQNSGDWSVYPENGIFLVGYLPQSLEG